MGADFSLPSSSSGEKTCSPLPKRKDIYTPEMSPVSLLRVEGWRWEAGGRWWKMLSSGLARPLIRGNLSAGFHLPCSRPWSTEQGKPEVVRQWGSDLGVKGGPAPFGYRAEAMLFNQLLAAAELIFCSPFVGLSCLSLSWLSGDRK